MPPKAFSVNFEKTLLACEKEYRSSRGDECEAVLERLMETLTSDGQYKLKGTMKDLKKVSLELNEMGSNLIHLGPENSDLV
jgi:hypothetical protein